MKKIFTLIGFIAVIGLAFFACPTGGGGGGTTPTHKCPSLDVHYLTCEEYSCTIGGHTQKAIGSTTVGGCPIYITKGVAPENAPAAIANINTAIGYLGAAASITTAKIEKIRLVLGTSVTSNKDSNEKYIVNIGLEATAVDIANYLMGEDIK